MRLGDQRAEGIAAHCGETAVEFFAQTGALLRESAARKPSSLAFLGV